MLSKYKKKSKKCLSAELLPISKFYIILSYCTIIFNNFTIKISHINHIFLEDFIFSIVYINIGGNAIIVHFKREHNDRSNNMKDFVLLYFLVELIGLFLMFREITRIV